MIMKAFAIYDGKGLCYGVPFFMGQSGQAVRAFDDLVNDERSAVNKHAGDYVLYEIGTFDDNDGVLKSIAPQVLLGHGLDFKKVTALPVSPVDVGLLPVNGEEKK